jgi:hypothetical protein
MHVPACPNCGSRRFVVEQLTFNRQTWDTDSGEWSASYDFDYETEYPLRATCQQCDADCTEALADRLDFYIEGSLRKREAQPR